MSIHDDLLKVHLHTRENSDAAVATTAKTGEVVKLVHVDSNQAHVVFHRKYGKPADQGYRTVMLVDDGNEYTVITQVFAHVTDPDLDGATAPDPTPATARPIGPSLLDVTTYEVTRDGLLFCTCDNRDNAVEIGEIFDGIVWERNGRRTQVIYGVEPIEVPS